MSLQAPLAGAAPSGDGDGNRHGDGNRNRDDGSDQGIDLPVADRWVQRRVSIIWGFLFLNVLAFRGGSPNLLLPISKTAGTLITGGALAVALLLALSLNRRLDIRPNVVLALATVLGGIALAVSLLGGAGVGAVIRSVRLLGFLAVLWLLTPWWGRRDLLLVRCHLRALIVVCGTVLLGLLIHPSVALSGSGQHRLVGIIWPIPAPQVAEYAAVAAGMAIILWLSGRMHRTTALLLAGTGSVMVLATQTRTALIAFVVAVIFGAATLFVTRARVRRVVAIAVIVIPIAAIVLLPAFSVWFDRHQSNTERSGLTGRKQVWDALLAAPRPEFNRWFGFGLSDKSFGGLSIDSTWLAIYQDEGLIGDAIVAVTLGILLIAPSFQPPGAARAVATFLVVYCVISSYTEVGLGDASPYVLSIVVAASLVASGRRRGQLAAT